MSKNNIVQEMMGQQGIEPIEAWQVIAVERLDGDGEPARWGHDGRHVLAWFDLGELREHLEGQGSDLVPSQQTGFATASRILQWIRSLVAVSHRYRLAGNAT